MRKYILYEHGGSANHGNEALIRTTAELFNTKRHKVTLISSGKEYDEKYHLDEVCNIVSTPNLRNPYRDVSVPKFSKYFIKSYKDFKINGDGYLLNHLPYVYNARANRHDVALSMGGDNYCYGPDCYSVFIRNHKIWKAAGLKTVLWGCSVEPASLSNPVLVDDLSGYDIITARESISYEALKQINPKTMLVCDSAFLLKKKDVFLPESFKNCRLVGINASPLILNYVNDSDLVLGAYQQLISFILKKTDMKILLIPHVVFDGNNDLSILTKLYELFGCSDRMMIVNDSSCDVLKGYISECSFFVGARTHATIAAYSSCVPTLVVGYSVKSQGIATDLFGTTDHFVVSVDKMRSSSDLLDSFIWQFENEKSIRSHLVNTLPNYISRIDPAVERVKNL